MLCFISNNSRWFAGRPGFHRLRGLHFYLYFINLCPVLSIFLNKTGDYLPHFCGHCAVGGENNNLPQTIVGHPHHFGQLPGQRQLQLALQLQQPLSMGGESGDMGF